MPDILVVTTSERVKGLFLSLERTGGVRVRTAASLPLAELGISLSTPDRTFIHGQVSGYPLDVLIRHMKTILPGDAKFAVLADDAEETAQAANHGVTVFDLSIDERVLKSAIIDVLQDAPDSLTDRTIEVKAIPEPAAPDPEADLGDVQKKKEIYAALRMESYGKSDGEPVAEVAGSPSHETDIAPVGRYEASDRITVRSTDRFSGQLTVRDLLQQPEWSEQLYGANSENLHRRRKAKFALAAVALFVILPLSSYYLHQSYQPGTDAARTAAGERQPAVRSAPTLPTPVLAAKLAATTEQDIGMSRREGGLSSLPTLLTQCKFDPEYGKTHPGWERYVGANYEYKLFKKEGLYTAMKVVPLKDMAISGHFLKKMLLEFSGAENYQVSSTKRNRRYLVFRGTTETGVAIALYKEPMNKMTKAFAFYYPSK